MGSSASLVQHQELIDDYERNYLLSVKLKKNIKEDTVLLSAMENEERDCEVPGNVVTRPSADQPVPVVKKETFLRTELLLAVVPKFLEELSTFTSSYHGIDIATLEDAEKKAAREAVKHVDGVELSNIMPNKEWFSLFIKSVEKLFMCVSIATARADRPGFPLIYVNSAFEMSTGYDRKDIIGTNCKFLQSEKTDPQHIEQLSTALRTGTSTRVTIVNRRKDGKPILK